MGTRLTNLRLPPSGWFSQVDQDHPTVPRLGHPRQQGAKCQQASRRETLPHPRLRHHGKGHRARRRTGGITRGRQDGAPSTRRHRGPPTSAGDKHEEAQRASTKCNVQRSDGAPGTRRHIGPPTSAGDTHEEAQRASYKCTFGSDGAPGTRRQHP